MDAELSETGNEHHWTLRDSRVTQLHIDPSSFRVETWSLQGSLEIRLSTPFIYREADGQERQIDPEKPEQLAPLLTLLNVGISTILVTRMGTVDVRFADGSQLHSESHPRFEAWEINGGGVLEGIGYLAGPGGSSPWG